MLPKKSRRCPCFFPLLTIIWMLLACNLPVMPGAGLVESSAVRAVVDGLTNGTATPTPFQPIPPTATSLPTATPEVTIPPEPTAEPLTSTPTAWYTGLQLPEGQMLVMILGTDARPGGGFRTDVMELVAINPQQGTVNLVSFPRDLYVFIPGWGMNRLNTAQGLGGFQLLADTMEYNFGFRPHHYISTNFQGFVDIVNNLGGIEVNAAENLNDKCDLPQASLGYCSVGPGLVQMDGETALWYVRSRYSTSDFDRTRRAQEVMLALFSKLISINALERVPDLYQAYRNNVETDLSLVDLLPLVPFAAQISQTGQIHRYMIGPAEVWPYIVPESGAQVLWPNPAAIANILGQAVFAP